MNGPKVLSLALKMKGEGRGGGRSAMRGLRKRSRVVVSLGASTSSCEDEDSSSSEQPFQKLSTRGGDGSVEAKPNKPRETPQRRTARDGEVPRRSRRRRSSHRMGRSQGHEFVNQILMANHSSQTMGNRNVREAQTLGSAIDMLMAGNLGGLGDLLMQRLKALETAVAEQSWSSARHQELISPQSASSDEPGRTREGREGRTTGHQAPGSHGEEQDQIGMGRRGEESRSSRDATSIPLRQSLVKERKPRDVQPEGERDPVNSPQFSKWGKGAGEEKQMEVKEGPNKWRKKNKRKGGWWGRVWSSTKERKGEGEDGPPGDPKKEPSGVRKPESYTPSIDQESHCSEVSESAVGEALTALRRWLKDNDVGGLSISQTAAHVLIQIKKSENHLSRYMKKMLAEPDPGSRKERQRSILPLPCLLDSKVAVNEIWASEEFKRLAGSWSKKKGMSSSKIHRR